MCSHFPYLLQWLVLISLSFLVVDQEPCNSIIVAIHSYISLVLLYNNYYYVINPYI